MKTPTQFVPFAKRGERGERSETQGVSARRHARVPPFTREMSAGQRGYAIFTRTTRHSERIIPTMSFRT